MARRKGWTCQRVTLGSKCRAWNPPRSRKCGVCGKPRPVRKEPAHRVGLTAFTYDDYIALNKGEFCAICRRGPGTRRLDRDHDHKTGRPRGLLCARCNRALPSWVTEEWLSMAAGYLGRASGITNHI